MQPEPLHARPRCLSSFWYLRKKDLRELLRASYGTNPPDIFLDSGAFTALNEGKTIDVQDYIDYVHANGDLVTEYANLDVIGDWKGSAANQREMESQGLSPLPVYHAGSPLRELDRICDEYEYFALGGVAKWTAKRRRVVMLDLWKRIRANGFEGRVHGFGITSMELMRGFPWYSVDSSTWTMPLRWGTITLFRGGLIHQMAVSDTREIFKHAAQVKKYGWDVVALSKDTRDRGNRVILSALSLLNWMKAEDWITKRNDAQFRIYFAHTLEYEPWPLILAEVMERLTPPPIVGQSPSV